MRATSAYSPPAPSNLPLGRRPAGFTLLEILVVLLLLGLVSSVVGPAVWRGIEGAQRRGELADAQAFLQQLVARRFMAGQAWVLDEAALAAIPGRPGDRAQWLVPAPIAFAAHGACAGGEVRYRPASAEQYVSFRLAPTTCAVSRHAA